MKILILLLLISCRSTPQNFDTLIDRNPITSERLKSKRYNVLNEINYVKIYKVVDKVIDSLNNTIIKDRKLIKTLSEKDNFKLREILLNDQSYQIDNKIDNFIPEYNIDFVSENGDCTIVVSFSKNTLSFICNLDGNIIFSLHKKSTEELKKLIL